LFRWTWSIGIATHRYVKANGMNRTGKIHFVYIYSIYIRFKETQLLHTMNEHTI